MTQHVMTNKTLRHAENAETLNTEYLWQFWKDCGCEI